MQHRGMNRATSWRSRLKNNHLRIKFRQLALRRQLVGFFVSLVAIAASGTGIFWLTRPAVAAVAPSQQWPTSITPAFITPPPGGNNVGDTRTLVYGSTGITATETNTSLTTPGVGCGMTATNGATNSTSIGMNGLTFTEPDLPAGGLYAFAACNINNRRVSTVTFNKPIIAPIFHAVNLDGSRLAITGNSTTGAPIGLTTIVKNNLMDVSGTTLNNTVQTPSNAGCADNSGGNPNGACGSFRITAASGQIQTITLDNNLISSPNPSDGWNWSLSFPSAPLTKAFNPSTITTIDTSQLTFSITNPNESSSVTLTPLDFTDNLPAGVTLAAATATTNGNCGAPAFTDAANNPLAVGAGSFKTTNISVAVGATCTITITVKATSAGSYVNNNSNMSTEVGNLIPNVDATLTVNDVYDFGDAPNGLDTTTAANGPRHSVPGYNPTAHTAALMLGSTIDVENDGQPNTTATGDDINTIDDEDGVAAPINVIAGQTTAVTISATNNTGNAASLAGWIDLNNNGTFETAERATLTVPANSGTANYILNFPAGTTITNTFARFRLYSTIVANPSPLGSAVGGEVEDYLVQAGHVQYRKSVSPASTLPFNPGQTFTYTVVVENVGNVPLTGLSFTDDLSAVLDDATYNNDEAATSGTVSYSAPTITWSGDLVPGDDATVTYSVTINTPISGDAILANNVVGTGPGSNCAPPGPSTDPNCLTRSPQPNITSVKTLVSPTNPNAGDTVTYRFTISNIGGAAATGVTIADDLSGILDDAVYNNDAAITVGTGTLTYNAANQRLVWQGDLAAISNPGDTITVQYTVTVNGADALNDGILDNGLLAPDCPNPPIYDSSDPDYDADCVTSTPIRAWMATKSVSPSGNVRPGDDLTYTITMHNTGGANLTGLTLTDELAEVVDDADYNNDANASAGTVSYAPTNVTWNGDLAIDEEVTVTFSVTVKAADALDEGILTNAITGSPNCPDPAITNPGDPGFNPDCVTTNNIAAWTVVKTSSPAGPVEAGDVVTYTMTVTNTGATNLTGLSTSDNLGDVLDDAAYNNNANATIGSVDYTRPVLAWSGNLNVGQSSTITYSATIDAASPAGDGVMRNAVTGGTCPDPAITDPANPGFNADCVTITPIDEWTTIKSATPAGTTTPGQVITYTILVENTGGTNLTGPNVPIVNDNLTDVLDDATYNNDGAASSGTVNYSAPTVTWTGDLNQGTSAQFSYSITVNNADALGDGLITNAINGSPNCPTPAITDPTDTAFNADCVTFHPVEAWTVVKTSSTLGPVQAGDTVTYVLTIDNTGATNLTGKTVTDNLTDVLDDATYNNDQTATIGTASYSTPTLTWTGDLATGTTATVTYSVTVNPASADGNGSLRNAVVGGTCPDPVISDPSDPNFANCVTITPVSEWIASKASNPANVVDADSTVTYTITVRNTGTVNLTGGNAPAIDDDMTEVLDDAVYNSDASATIGTPAYAAPVLSWTNDLNAGQTASITYTTKVHGATSLGDGIMTNAITGSPNCPDPAITDPAATGYKAECAPVLEAAAYTVKKTASPADGTELHSGDTVTYTITIENTGIVPVSLYDFVLIDDLTDVLDDATLTGSPIVNPAASGTATITGTKMNFTGNVPVGTPTTITYAAKVKPEGQLGNRTIVNAVAAAHSTCAVFTNPTCRTSHPIPAPGMLANAGRHLLPVIGAAVLLSFTALIIYRRRQQHTAIKT